MWLGRLLGGLVFSAPLTAISQVYLGDAAAVNGVWGSDITDNLTSPFTVTWVSGEISNYNGFAVSVPFSITIDGTTVASGTTTVNAGSTSTFYQQASPSPVLSAGGHTIALVSGSSSNSRAFTVAPGASFPEIAVEQPAGTNVADGGSKGFGSVNLGSNASLTFTIKNTGTANLTGLTITKDGTNANDFTVTSSPAALVASGFFTTFSVQFSPSVAGTCTAAIHIANNDANENPFDISLSGTGLPPQEAWRLTHFGSSANTGNAANTADPDRDGLNNLLEFGFGLHPTQPSAHLAPKWQRVGGNLTVTFTHPAAVSGITYGAEWSPSLTPGSWQPIADTGTAPQHTFGVPMDGSQRKFVRLLITSTETPEPDGFALIPAGSFQMGDQSNPLVGDSAELPARTVFVSAFYIGKYEVTKDQWDAVRAWGLSNEYTDLPTGSGTYSSKGVNHPVHSISWYAMVKWCNARSQREGFTPCYTVSGATYKTGDSAPVCNWSANGYRLPTEAEWEKAARGGVSAQNFPWGNTITHSQANYVSSIAFDYDVSPTRSFHPTYTVGGSPYSSPVGSFPPNGYGLYDMAGNMWEWCWDWYGSYAEGSQTDPRGPSSGSYRVSRGGSWNRNSYYCRVANRYNDNPVGSSNGGFRVARSSVP